MARLIPRRGREPHDPSLDLAAAEPGADDAPSAPAEPFPTLGERWLGWWRRTTQALADDPARMLEAVVTVTILGLGTALILATLHPTDLFSDTTPTGGDMGSHVWGPRQLIDHLLPNLRLSGWTPDWYSGFPAYQFYMVVPSLLIVALHLGLPPLLAVPAALASLALAAAGWMREGLYRWRWVLFAVGMLLLVLSVPISYNRSFKLVTVLGLLTLPLACWVLGKAARLAFPIPPLMAAGGLIFLYNREPLFNNTGNIIGGNFQSTMAGEFAFSVSLTLSVLYLAVAVKGLRTGRHRALAALLFALAGLCHLIPAFFVLGCTAALFLVHPDRARFRWLVTMVPVAGLLTAFWVLPFFWRRDYVNDMGWERLPLPSGEETSVWYYLIPGGLKYLLVMGLLGVVLSLVRGYRVGLVLALAWLGVSVAFAVLPQARLWNARLLPFLYLSVALLAAIGVGELLRIVGAAASGNVERPLRFVTVTGSLLAVVGVLIYTALPISGLLVAQPDDNAIERWFRIERTQVTTASNEAKTEARWGMFATTASNPASGWSANNYSGLEEKDPIPAGCDAPGSTVACTSGGWEEYRHLVQTMAGVGIDPRYGCGRAFWEYEGDRIGGYGTPMALMMLPYFTDGCIGSQEGLYFESSATVPYHFLMQAELSAKPSQPQRDLTYPGFDIDAGVRHLQLLGVRYYLAASTSAVDQAGRHPDLTEIAVSGPWHVYEVAESEAVAALDYEPVVLTGIDESQHGWLPMASAWFSQTSLLEVPFAADGPEEWRRVEATPVPEDLRRLVRYARDQLGESGAIDEVPELPRTPLPAVEVSDIEMGQDTISFSVSEPGVPVLVRTSYFPNWEVEGAEGPYRVSPNLMVVVPTDTEVSMHFGRTPIDLIATGMTVLGLVGLVLLARARPIVVPPEVPNRLSAWIDRQLTITPRPTAAVVHAPPQGPDDPAGTHEPEHGDDPAAADGLDHPDHPADLTDPGPASTSGPG